MCWTARIGAARRDTRLGRAPAEPAPNANCAKKRATAPKRSPPWASYGLPLGPSDELMQLYLAENLTPAPLPGDEDEAIEVVAMPLAELEKMAWDGRLLDGKSVVAILRTAHLLAQR